MVDKSKVVEILDEIEDMLEGMGRNLLSEETDRRILALRGNGKNSDIIMDEDGEIVGFEIDGKVHM